MTDVLENGILVGWFSTMRNAHGKPIKIFIPRRDEDIDADRAAFGRVAPRRQRAA